MEIEAPWLPNLATEFLERRIKTRWECFEWGSGASTLWLAERCARVVSVEHNPEWRVKRPPPNCECLLVQPERGEVGPDPSEPSHYRSGSTELGPGWNWKKYAEAIDAYGEFDLVLVDGMARASCIARAVPHVRPGGWLAVDNTGDRPWYLARNIGLFGTWDGGWERATFFGRGPLLSYLWECSFFGRPAE